MFIELNLGVKPYACPLCPATFRIRSHGKAHVLSHIKGTNVNWVEKQTSRVSSLASQANSNAQNRTADEAAELAQQPAEVIPLSEVVGGQSGNVLLTGIDQIMETPAVAPAALPYQVEEPQFSINTTLQIDPAVLQQLQSNGVYVHDNIDEACSFIQLDINNEGLITNVKTVSNEAVSKKLNRDATVKVVPSGTKHQCSICSKKYSRVAILNKHLKTHGSGSFTCSKCLRRFNSNEELLVHEASHSGDVRTFSCELCSNTFLQEKHLKTHIKR